MDPRKKRGNKSERRTTASILKQDPNTKRFKRMLRVYDTETQSANFTKICRLCCVSISNKRSFELFMCLDLVDP